MNLVIRASLVIKGASCWAENLARTSNVAINVHACTPNSDAQSVQNWVEILADNEKIDTIKDQISNQVISSELTKVKDGRTVGVVVTSKCMAAEAVRDLTCTITSHTVETDGSIKLEILANGKKTLEKMIERFRNNGAEVNVLKLTSNVQEEKLTGRQEQIVRKALEMGYYDYPRRVRQKELANACGVASSTLAEILRRAERNILDGLN
jgi:predicted DNA binding protein